MSRKEVQLQVTEPSASEVIPAKDVVQTGDIVDTTDAGFWPNLHGGMNAGVNYSKQQNRTQYDFDANALFERAKGWLQRITNPVSVAEGISPIFATRCD